jgi:S1-C subfamily serine protease
MSEQFPRNETSLQERSRTSHPYRNALVVALLVAFGAFGFLRDQLTFADTATPTVEAANPANSSTSTTGELLAAQQTAEAETLSVADVAEAANPSVVTVYNLQTIDQSRNPMFGQPQIPSQYDDDDQASDEPQAVGAGSGWIYDSEGHVVTNNHVVEGAEEVQVAFSDGTIVDATVVGTDPIQDVAVLQLELEDGQELPGVATVGDSSALRPGDEVVAIGTALGEFTNSVSDGIIGGLDRSLDTDTGAVLDNLIQHDAEISSGNSGGPLLNMQGEVIGMNVAKIDTSGQQQVSASGLNFAIDGNTVVEKVNQIIQDGDVVYPYLGVETQTDGTATVVINVVEDGPAAAAGIQPGDVITAVAGEEVGPNAQLTQLLYEHNAGDTIEITVDRDGETLTLTVTLGERPSSIN